MHFLKFARGAASPRCRRCFWLAPVLWGALVLVTPLTAEETARKPDVRLVIDVSGSMKRNDPKNLRQPAVDLLVRLMPDGGKAGVWTFGKQVNMLVPHQQVDSRWRSLAGDKSQHINSVGLYTNIGGALEKSAFDRASPSTSYATSIILLTDGMVDISKQPAENEKEWRRIVEELLPELVAADFTVHTIALSDNADDELMEKLALATDGTAAVARSADDLMRIFLRAFEVAAPAQEVPLENNAFAVDSSIDEFTALIFRANASQQTQLIGPDQAVATAASPGQDVQWFRAEGYDLITVTQPLEGEWQIVGDVAPDSRITIVSDLSLRVKQLPTNAFQGAVETLTFLLQQEAETITSRDFLGLLDIQLSLEHHADGVQAERVWSKRIDAASPPADGIYAQSLPELDKLGTYTVGVAIDGKTFKRQFDHQISVREPFTATLDQSNEGGNQYVLTVRSHSDAIDPSKTQIAATVVKPDRRSLVRPLGVTEQGRWQTLLHLDQTGDYRVAVNITGEDERGQLFEHKLQPLLLNHDPDAAFVVPSTDAEPNPEPVSTPEPPATPIPDVEPALEAAPLSETDTGTASWLMYVLLGIGNLLLLGGGYFVFRKWSGRHDEQLDTDSALLSDAPDDDDQDAPALDAELFAMDDGEIEPEPPMEDLDLEPEAISAPDVHDETEMDLDVDDDLDELDEPADFKQAAQPVEADPFADSEEDSWTQEEGVSDLDETLVEQFAGDASAEEKADFADEILKAQGLDLAEDELDDAISSLIDELDGSREADEEEPPRDEK